MNSKSDKVISLFSGAGGFSYGFSMAGHKPIFGAEINQDACQTYEENIGSKCHNIDISTIDPNFFINELGSKSPFAIIGGPPCQGFSTAGSRKSNDPRNRLIFNYLNIVNRLKPRWFIFENVEGLLTSACGDSITSLVREFLAIGYNVRVEKVNMASYGVPQTRKRVLIVGNNIGLKFNFPEEQFSYDSGKSKKQSRLPFAPTLDSALSGLGHPTRSKSDFANYIDPTPSTEYDRLMRNGNSANLITDHFDRTTQNDALRYSHLSCGQTMKDMPEEFWHESFKRRAFRRVSDGTPTEKRGGAPSGIKRLHGSLQSLTITGAASREFIHPRENRTLTIRECARIQSFPDSFQFSGNAASKIQQIGNAVPPLGAKFFAHHIESIDGSFGADVQAITSKTPELLGFHLTESIGKSEALKRTEEKLSNLMQHNLELFMP